MSSEQAPAPNRAPCAAHGLFYDPQLAKGCVLCLRERAQTEAAVRGGGRSLALLLAALGLVLAAVGVAVVRSGALAGWQGRGNARAAVITAEADGDASHRGPRPARGRPLRVLFVGNSLTSVNDLPAMVAKLSEAASTERPFEPHAVTFDGFTLRDHLAANAFSAQLGGVGSGATWDAVVLQEQGQRPAWPQSREREFFASARTFDQAIRQAGARTVLYSTMARRDGDAGNFPGDDYAAMQQRLDEGYGQLARELHAELVPVGRAWRTMLRRRPELVLWQPDGLHPTTAGTYLAACAFYATFYRQSPVGNAYVAGLLPAEALAIQDVASLAVLDASASEATLAQLESPRAPKGPSLTAMPTPTPAKAVVTAAAAQRPDAEQDRERHERIARELEARAAAMERERRDRMETDIKAQEQRSGRRRVPVAIYKTAWCGACKRASAYMQREGIAVREYDIEHDGQARAIYRQLNPSGGVPTIDVDGAVLVGWSEPRFEAMLADALSRRAH